MYSKFYSDCRFCIHYSSNNARPCDHCSFEFNEEEYNPYLSDDWDILNLDEDGDWIHYQVMDRLHLKGIDCYFVDMWSCDTIAFIVGCNAKKWKLARALNISEDCIYIDFDHCFIILNLFQEKYIRDHSKE